MAPRKKGWRLRLNAVITGAASQPFAWGAHDCGCFAASCVEAITGDDTAAALRGTYSDAKGAAKALIRNGAKDLAEFAAQRFAELPHPSAAQVGDLALLPGDATGLALGVFVGELIVVMTPQGRGFVPRNRAVRAFTV
jgi:hypothetical protein